jgi:hypothetical protein
MQESSGITLVLALRGFWPHHEVAPHWPAASWQTQSCCRSSVACVRPYGRGAASSPARVRSIVSSSSIWARLADMTWKKKRPEGVLVSMASVRLLNSIPCLCKSLTRSTRFLTLRPSRSSFQTTRVSPSRSIPSLSDSPERSARLPLILSSKIFLQPALVKASI